jgi:hypothetical protein
MMSISKSGEAMRDEYDFSTGIRSKYFGKVNTTNIRLLDSAKPAAKAGTPTVRNTGMLSRARKKSLSKSPK